MFMQLTSSLFLAFMVILPWVLSTTLRWPVIGVIALCAVSVILPAKHRNYGNKLIWIGLGIMLCVSGFNGTSWLNILLLPVYGLVMLAGLQLRDLWIRKSFAFLIILQCIGVIVMLFFHTVVGSGGFIDPINYNIATALTLIAFLLCYDKWKWWVLPITILAIYLTSAEEAIIYTVILLITILIRRDWSKKIIPTVGTVVICVVLFFGFHVPSYLYMVANDQLAVIQGREMPYPTDPSGDISRGRMYGYKLAITTPSVIGHGFDSQWDTPETVHNVPLRVLYDLGFIGLFGFILAMYGWVRKTNIYIIVLLSAMMIFDHFLWTQAGLWFWLLIGMSYNVVDTHIFRNANIMRGVK